MPSDKLSDMHVVWHRADAYETCETVQSTFTCLLNVERTEKDYGCD